MGISYLIIELLTSQDNDQLPKDENLEGFTVENENNKDLFSGSSSDQHSLEQQRHIRLNQEKEQKQLQQREFLAAEKEKQQQENERIRRKELVSNHLLI